MKKYVPINDVIKEIRKSSLRIWTDKVSYFHILLIWVVVIVLFGYIYFYLQNGNSFLFYNIKGTTINNIRDAVYFSFVAATTTGFGDILPNGWFKLIAIVEVVFGLMLLAIVTSKLVSIKQDVILGELYELSFDERINRLRSSLLLFRQNLERMINKIEGKIISKRELNNLCIYLSSMEDTLNEVLALIRRPSTNHFIKNIDPVDTELIFNSILSSFNKLYELLTIMEEHKIEWRTGLTVSCIGKCIEVTEELFRKLDDLKNLMKPTVTEFNLRKSEIIEKINKVVSRKE